jgi:hypothetical protein
MAVPPRPVYCANDGVSLLETMPGGFPDFVWRQIARRSGRSKELLSLGESLAK